MKISGLLNLLSVAGLTVGSPSFTSQYELDGSSNRKEGGSIMDELRENKRFEKFTRYLEENKGLRNELEGNNKATVFAPCNEAFEEIESAASFNKEKIRDILQYHISPDTELTEDCLHAGLLIPSGLKEKNLDDRHQRIRTFEFNGEYYLNMQARVDVNKVIEASNGNIFPISKVLEPPCSLRNEIWSAPTFASTWSLAVERTGLERKLTEHGRKGVTALIPSNHAWKSLGLANLRYLFSCVGQENSGGRRGSRDWNDSDDESKRECQGTKDLKKIVEYHVAREVQYSTDFMNEKTTKLETLCGHEMIISSKRVQSGDSDKDRRRNDRNKDRKNRDEDRDEKKHRDVREYNFIVNDGAARITVPDSILGNNGAVHFIDTVIVPQNIELPYDRWAQ
ncbi:hypothetical protein HKX48_000744 [Thoreauomyces humboldtii]|nr:hypothetical protein HKX48_000744 [Thoreauomyces humboldtii]